MDKVLSNYGQKICSVLVNKVATQMVVDIETTFNAVSEYYFVTFTDEKTHYS